MRQRKLEIPMPDEATVQAHIRQIVDAGLPRRVSFFALLQPMVRQVGFRQLFSDGTELVFAALTAITFVGVFLFKPNASYADLQELYGYIFLTSPVLFLVLSLFTVFHKVLNGTIELEMTCRYTVYQIIAFRMLAFSVVAMLCNTLSLIFLSFLYEEVQFVRAFMISHAGLFLFAAVFLFVVMKRRALVSAAAVTAAWTLGNLFLMVTDNPLYRFALVQLPLFVVGLVLAVMAYVYLKCLRRLMHFQHAEGVFT